MSATTPCPAIADLRAFLNGELAAEIQAKIAHHIDGCSSCQEGLERMAAGKDSWRDAAQHLGKPPTAADPLLQGIMNRLQAEPIGATTAESAQPDLGSLDFLDPAEKPGQLGRLAHYDILEMIGHGGMGIVLKAYDTKLQRVCAIKVMMPELAARGTARQRFIREARAAAAITHEHVVTIHAVEEDHSPPYLVMQYIGGRSLQQRIDECGAFEVKEILRIGMQAASGLAAAHAQGLVHRDIKPANILLENGVERVKITDFGLARAVDDARVTQSGVVTGTPQYMAPEQARGEGVDHRADLFSLGGVMYAMCTGYAPFRASSSMAVLKKVCDERPRPIRDLNPEIPGWLATIVETLMAKDAKDRFQSASELANVLNQHLAHLQQPAVFPTPPEIVRPIEFLPATKPANASLKLPILLMIAPFVLTPILLLAAFVFLDAVPWFVLMITALTGGISFFAGVVLLITRLASGRSYGGVAIVLVLVLLFVVCPVPIFGLLGVFLFGWTTMRTSGPSNPTATITEEIPSSDDGRTVEEKNRATVNAHKLSEIGKAMHRFGAGDNASLIDGLNWFPEESTACASYSFPAAPAELSDAFWSYLRSLSLARIAANQMPSPVSEICDSIGDGSIMRVSYAMVDDPAGVRTRHFLRVSGLWNRDRVIRSLVGKLKTTRTDLPPFQEQKVTILRREDCAIAAIGSTDLVLARFEKNPAGPDGHESAIRELLACKESHQRSLCNGPLAAEIAHTPGNSFMLASGELPEGLRESFAGAMAAAPVKITLSVAPGDGSGASYTLPQPMKSEPGIVVFFRATMRNKTDAEAFAKNRADWPKLIHEFLDRSLNQAEAKLKNERDAKKAAAAVETIKQFRSGPPVKVEATTNGFDVEGKIQIPATVMRAFGLCLKGKSALGEPGKSPRFVGEIQLKRFNPKLDKPFQSEVGDQRVTIEDGAWRIDATKESGPRQQLRLFELPKQNVEHSTVVLRFKMKTAKISEAAAAAVTLQVGRDVSAQVGENSGRVNGTTDWKNYELRCKCDKLQSADVVISAGVSRLTGTMWLKDIEVVKIPNP